MMRVVVLSNEPVLPPSHHDAISEWAVSEAADFVAEQLTRAGLAVLPLRVAGDFTRLQAELLRHPAAVVVNLFEGLADSPNTESLVAYLLSRSGVAFTGSGGRALAVAKNKPLAKNLLARNGLPTPRWHVVNSANTGELGLAWPVIVKPCLEDASLGIDQSSVVVDRRQLESRVREVQARFGRGVLLEEYVPGREVSVAMIGSPRLVALPPIEFAFDPSSGGWPILTYDSKWQLGSLDYETSRAVYGADLPAGWQRDLNRLALQAFRLLGCRDYARVDFRIAANGQPYILEVNPNPDLSPTACFCGALRSAGISPAEWLVRLVRTAQRRGQKRMAQRGPRLKRNPVARN
jgi:D-alanine-D-alanine ligase